MLIIVLSWYMIKKLDTTDKGVLDYAFKKARITRF